MSTRLTFSLLILFLAGCRPAFDSPPSSCVGERPQPRCGPNCQLFRERLGRPPEPLARSLITTRFVDHEGWKTLERNPLNGPLAVQRLLAVSGAQVLVEARPTFAVVDSELGVVSSLASVTSPPPRWAHGPAGGFFLFAGSFASPSSPQLGAARTKLPAGPTLTAVPAELPFATDLASGSILLPTSDGLFLFRPGDTRPFTRLAEGTFTAATVLGGDVYASRCEPMPDTEVSRLEAMRVVPVDGRCDVLRAPIGSTAFEVLASLEHVVELVPYEDRVLVRTPFELSALARGGARVVLTAVPRPAQAGLPEEAIGPLLSASPSPRFWFGRCVIELDATMGTVVLDAPNPLEVELPEGRVVARPE